MFRVRVSVSVRDHVRMLSYWAWICLVEADYVLKVYISYMAVTLALDRSHKTSLALNQKGGGPKPQR